MQKKNLKINVTKDYRLFGRSDKNRVLNVDKRKQLRKSMEEQGFLPCFPIVCMRDETKSLIVLDGQHRLALAETLGLPVYWYEAESEFDVPLVNGGIEKWNLRAFAESFAARGLEPYQDAIEFSESYSVPLGLAFSMLGGTVSFSNIRDAVYEGRFQVKDRPWADKVAAVYSRIVQLQPRCRNAQLIAACMCVCRVSGFKVERLLKGAERCVDKLQCFSNKDAYLDMLETIYNFGQTSLVPLKINAIQAMRERDVTASKTKPKGK